ncbi:MAG: hypothetical protein HOH04_03955 [Rhodospirillaceae bacterium]|jgi:hypothetical protein|nr:hypothetical protein [Rhodospirillaceae bacterium]
MVDLSRIHDIQDSLNAEQIIFCYAGYITEDVLLSVGNTIKQKLEVVQADRSAARAIFAIFVEEAQNVIRYSKAILGDEINEGSDVLRRGFIAVGKTDGRYYVCCGNLVQRDDVERLDGLLQHIKSLDEAGLKALYKKTLREDPPEGSKGAGVGFVDIARRAKGGFDYLFKDIDAEYAYFYLSAYA